MLHRFSSAVLLTASLVSAQSPDVLQAEQEAARARSQVAAGVVGHGRLAQAERDLADTQDDLVLRRTLYGTLGVQELSESQSEEMIGAAQRRIERQKQTMQRTQMLIDLGAVPRIQLQPLQEELARREKTLELAEARATLMREIARMAQVEQTAADATLPMPRTGMERFSGKGTLQDADLHRVRAAFQREFGKPLPVSAWGETATHRAMGFDHRGRVDVAVNPDQKEGEWLRRYLQTARLPYYAFRHAIAGKATGAHFHIGPPSLRYTAAD